MIWVQVAWMFASDSISMFCVWFNAKRRNRIKIVCRITRFVHDKAYTFAVASVMSISLSRESPSFTVGRTRTVAFPSFFCSFEVFWIFNHFLLQSRAETNGFLCATERLTGVDVWVRVCFLFFFLFDCTKWNAIWNLFPHRSWLWSANGTMQHLEWSGFLFCDVSWFVLMSSICFWFSFEKIYLRKSVWDMQVIVLICYCGNVCVTIVTFHAIASNWTGARC